jgi:hypothetical protein
VPTVKVAPVESRAVRGVALFLVLACACSGGPRPAAPVAMREDRWTPLTWEERHDRMTFLVHPNMARLFQHHDGKPAPDMTCRTCHGEDAEQVAYAMPRGLTALDPERMPDPAAPTVRFMTSEVMPTMADLLGVDRRRFTCFGCHPRAR